MKIGARQRWIALVALLMAALTAAAWVRETERKSGTEIVEPPTRPRQVQVARGADPATPDRVHLEKLRGRDPDSNANDAFATRSWRKPAPKAAAHGVAAAGSKADGGLAHGGRDRVICRRGRLSARGQEAGWDGEVG